MIAFTIPLEPVAKGRPRVFNGRAVTPTKTRRFEQQVALLAGQHEPSEPFDGPVSVRLAFYLRRPKRLLRKSDPCGAVPCDRRPDVDNLAKSVLDGLARWWRDDAQISVLEAAKHYAEKYRLPRIEVEVSQL